MTEELLAKIGLDVSDLKRNAIEGAESLKNVKKEFKELKEILELGGVAMLAERIFSSIVEHAKKSEDQLEHNVQAVQRFGAGVESIKDKVLDWGVAVLGFFNRVGEDMGTDLAALFRGREQVEKTTKIAEDSARTLADLAKQKAITLADIEAAEKRVTAAMEKRVELEFSQLTHAEQRAQLANEIQAALAEAATLEEKSVRFQQLKADILEKQNKLIKLIGDDQKDEAAAAAASAEAAAKNRADAEAARLDALQKTRTESEALTAESIKIAQAWEEANNTIYKTVDGVSVLREEFKSYIAEWESFQVSIGRSGTPYESQSVSSLQGVLARLRGQIDPTGTGAINVMSPNYGAQISNGMLNSEIQAIERQLAHRSEVSGYIGRFGEDKARFQFGDADVNQALNDQRATSKQTASAVQEIADRLAGRRTGPG